MAKKKEECPPVKARGLHVVTQSLQSQASRCKRTAVVAAYVANVVRAAAKGGCMWSTPDIAVLETDLLRVFWHARGPSSSKRNCFEPCGVTRAAQRQRSSF